MKISREERRSAVASHCHNRWELHVQRYFTRSGICLFWRDMPSRELLPIRIWVPPARSLRFNIRLRNGTCREKLFRNYFAFKVETLGRYLFGPTRQKASMLSDLNGAMLFVLTDTYDITDVDTKPKECTILRDRKSE